MSNYFVFTPDSGSAIDSSTYNVLLSGVGTYGAPERDVTAVSIPGRNGDLIFDNGRFFNAEVFYDCGMSRTFQSDFDTFRSLMMLNSTTYGWLTDTYHPTEKRRARVARIEEISTTALNLGGRFRVVFDCKPQRFIGSGDTEQTLTNGTAQSITLNTCYPSYPLIKIWGSAVVYIDNVTVAITQVVNGQSNVLVMTMDWNGRGFNIDTARYIEIDCDNKSVVFKDTNTNQIVPATLQQTTSVFPFLIPPGTGTNSVKVTAAGSSNPYYRISLKTREYVV